jgi:hypothetical protein
VKRRSRAVQPTARDRIPSGKPVIHLSRLRLIAILVGGPILVLVAIDRVVVLSNSHWEWVAHEVPPQLLDPYRVEALLRIAEPGAHNVAILGNSTAEEIFDAESLQRGFAERGLRFHKLTIGGATTLSFGMLAPAVLALDPSAVILMVDVASVRGDEYLDGVPIYDVRAVPELFSATELIAEAGFHLDGLVGQAHVMARHRRAMQRALLVTLGRLSWERMRLDIMRGQWTELLQGERSAPAWAQNRDPTPYPNPNTRAIELLARRLRERDATFIVMEAPLHPAMALITGERRRGAFHNTLRALADEHGFAFQAAEDLPTLGEEHFKDMFHVNESGRSFFTERVTETLRGAL